MTQSDPAAMGKRRTSTAVWRPGRLLGSEVMFGDFVDHHFAPHEHDTWSIGWIVDGANQFRREGQCHTAPQGTVCVVNPSEVHTGGGDRLAYWSLMPSAALLQLAFPHVDADKLLTVRPVMNDTAALRAAQTLFRGETMRSCALSQQEAALVLLRAVLGRGSRSLANEARGNRLAVDRAMEYLHDRLDRQVSLEELSVVCGTSAFSLCREFSAQLGMSPGAWVRSRRIARAQDLIGRGLDLSEVAAQCGFSDQAHMTRLFRSVIGCTPAQWQRAA